MLARLVSEYPAELKTINSPHCEAAAKAHASQMNGGQPQAMGPALIPWRGIYANPPI